jgi:hypothetical protein
MLEANDLDPRRRPILENAESSPLVVCGMRPAMRLTRTTDGAVIICESSRFFVSSDPLEPPSLQESRLP